MEKQIINKFSELQDMAVGDRDIDLMSQSEFNSKYPDKSALLKEAEYWLSLYMDEDCMQGAERYDSNPRVRRNWANEVAKIKRFIARLKK